MDFIFSKRERKGTSLESKRQRASDTVKSFIQESPQSTYTFDSERDAQEAQLCRQMSDGTQRCIGVELSSKILFERMQELGFYCALPVDPARTHMECRPVPKL
ncbi:hypothetical protein FRC03_005363 [Tulasnella sp. 419]|nr:hypothetical protein FRC03_005363 [Tulasnella sp. 419]